MASPARPCPNADEGSASQGTEAGLQGLASPNITVTWAASPPPSPSLLRFSVNKQTPLAAWSEISYTVPTSVGLTVFADGADIPIAEFAGSFLSTSKMQVDLIPSAANRPKCYSRPVAVTADSGSLCAGLNPVRVCATSPAAADVYVETHLRPLLETITSSQCGQRLQDLCGGASMPSLGKSTCCQIAGTWDLGHCATDEDCGPPVTVSPKNERVMDVSQPCCAGCTQRHAAVCGSASPSNASCDLCTTAIPCFGYSNSKQVAVNPSLGANIALPIGAGMQIPPGVWPQGVGPATVSVYTGSVNVQPGKSLLSDPIFFGPSGITFPEPGVLMSFQADPALLVMPPGMQMLAFKIVDDELVEHAFAPNVDLSTGKISVKTLGFSAYVIAAVPIRVPMTSTPAPNLTTTFKAQTQTPPPVRLPAPPVANDEEEGGLKFIIVVVLIACGSGIGLSCLAIGLYLRQSGRKDAGKDIPEKSKKGKKVSMKSLESQRSQDSHPKDQYPDLSLSGDIVHADGREGGSSHGSSGFAGKDTSSEIEERLFEQGLEEDEPDMEEIADRPLAQSLGRESLSGSVGTLSFGQKPKPVTGSSRPQASESASSLVWHAPGPTGKREPFLLSSDLVVLSPMGNDEVIFEEQDPEAPVPVQTRQTTRDLQSLTTMDTFVEPVTYAGNVSPGETALKHSDVQADLVVLSRIEPAHDTCPDKASPPFSTGEIEDDAAATPGAAESNPEAQTDAPYLAAATLAGAMPIEGDFGEAEPCMEKLSADVPVSGPKTLETHFTHMKSDDLEEAEPESAKVDVVAGAFGSTFEESEPAPDLVALP